MGAAADFKAGFPTDGTALLQWHPRLICNARAGLAAPVACCHWGLCIRLSLVTLSIPVIHVSLRATKP